MRIWHSKLLPALDDFHIVAQYRELLAIKGAIEKNGTPNHRLVNKVLDFSISDFKWYFSIVISELNRRNIRYNGKKKLEVYNWNSDKFASHLPQKFEWYRENYPYMGWHNDRYLRQNFYNLQEKWDCGIVSDSAFEKIKEICKEVI